MGTIVRCITIYTALMVTVPGVRCLCLENCRRSSQTEQHCESVQCTEGCESGWFGSQCTRRCSHLCLGSLCDQDDGKCTIGCKRTGLLLHRYHHCPDYSKINRRSTNDRCHQHDEAGECICCIDNYRGKQCETYCENCRTIKGGDKCRYICQGGYFGTKCNMTCPNECAVGYSHKPECKASNDTYECISCPAGRYGAQCGENCRPNCRDELCHQFRATCDECIDNYFGQFCEKKCDPMCSGGLCLRNGTCLKGCKEASNGSLCQTSCIAKCSACNNTESIETCLSYCDEDCLLDICYGNGTCNNSHSEFESVCSKCETLVSDESSGTNEVPVLYIVGAVVGVVVIGISIVGVLIYRRCQSTRRRYNEKALKMYRNKDYQMDAESLNGESDREGKKVERMKSFTNSVANLISRPQLKPKTIKAEDMPELGRKINPTIAIFTESQLAKEAIDVMLDVKKDYCIKDDIGTFTSGEIETQKVVSIQLSSSGDVQVNNFVTRCFGYFKSMKHVFISGVCIANESIDDKMRRGDVVASVAGSDTPYIYHHLSEGTERQWTPKDDTLQNIAKVLASENEECPTWKKHVERGKHILTKLISPSEDNVASDVTDGVNADDEMPKLHCGVFGPKPVICEEDSASEQHVTAFDTGIQNLLDSITGNSIDSFVIIRGITSFQNEVADSKSDAIAAIAAASVARTVIERISVPKNMS